MRRRFISKNKAIILAAMLAASMAMNGCAGTSAISQSIEASESGTQDSSKVNILSLSDTVVYAYVDSIDGKELSLTLGSMSDGTDQMPGEPGGSGQPGDGQPSGGSKPGDKPSGDKPDDDESKSGKPDDNASKNADGESDKTDSDSDVDANESQRAADESKSANESQRAADESKSANESQPAADETQTDETQADETQSAAASDNGNNESKSESSSEVFTKGDMAAVLTISDESVISQEKDGEKTSASFSDIGKGSIIEVTIDENSSITSIEELDDSTVSETVND